MMWTGRQFSVEFEFYLNAGIRDEGEFRAAMVRAAGPAMVNPERVGWRSSAGRQWDLKTDGSLSGMAGQGPGREVASPRLTLDDDGECASLRSVCGELSQIAKVNEDCGLHVSVDASDFSWKQMQQLMALWARYEPFFFAVLPASRHGAHWCKPYRASKWDGVRQPASRWWPTVQRAISATTEVEFRDAAGSIEKYVSMRVNDWWRTGRVEFRLHSATLDYVKVRNYATILIALVNRVARTDAPRVSRKINQPLGHYGFYNRDVMKAIGLFPSAWSADHPHAARVRNWYDARQRKFARQLGIPVYIPGECRAVTA